MIRPGLRRIYTLLAAGAFGLSCTACLGPSVLSSSAISTTSPLYEANNQATGSEPIRLGPAEPYSGRHGAYEGTINLQTQNQEQNNSFSYSGFDASSRNPMGQISGVDLTVAEFAQATTNSVSPLFGQDVTGRFSEGNHIDASYDFIANSETTGLGLDLSINPRFSVDETGEFRSTRAGAEIRVGTNLDLRGQNTNNSNWYFFAGADGEAVVWDVQRAGASGANVSLQDRVTVGDVQAGVAWESSAGQMSISYIEREYQYRNGSISRSGEEDFVAFTMTWRR